MEQLSVNVVKGQGNLASQVRLCVEETNLSLLANVVSDTMIGSVSKRKPNLTKEECRALYDSLLLKVKNPREHAKLIKGALNDVAKQFGMTRGTIFGIWKRGKQSLAGGAGCVNVSSLK